MSSVGEQTGLAPLEGLRYIQNIGRFESVRGGESTRFAPLTLVYSENGRGKTTLCAILRSLTTGDAAPILERRRLSATAESKAVLNIAGRTISFNGTSWTAAGPSIAIFDEYFNDTNVHSGLNVDADHRKGVHELVVGKEGVRLQKHVESLADRISSLQNELRQNEQAIPAAALGSLSVDEFCALNPIEDLEKEIEAATRSLSMLRDVEAIRSASELNPFALPPLDLNSLVGLLGATLPELEATAVDAVAQHFSGRGAGIEHWVSEGLRYVGEEADCPFCGQGVSGSTVIVHYRAYFSEAYATHKQRIRAARERVNAELSGDRLAAFQRTVQEVWQVRDFWARYFSIPPVSLDLNELANAWVSARDKLLGALDAKALAPLEPISLDESSVDAIRRYRETAESVRKLSASLIEQNSTVRQTKEHATQGSAHTAQARLEHLQAVQRRFSPEVDAACNEYLATKKNKTAAEREKAEARRELDEHRKQVFGAAQTAINRFLDTFNADFSLDQLRPSDAAGVPSSSYGVRVNGQSVALNPPQTPDPSFRTALSSGDRNTLALAFFFASLERLHLSDTIVVIDDPISSLDDARAYATVQEIRKLQGRCRQLVVLSHSRSLLCQLWDRADKDMTATLEIRDDGPDRSKLGPWNNRSGRGKRV